MIWDGNSPPLFLSRSKCLAISVVYILLFVSLLKQIELMLTFLHLYDYYYFFNLFLANDFLTLYMQWDYPIILHFFPLLHKTPFLPFKFASFKPLVASSLSTYPSTSVVNLPVDAVNWHEYLVDLVNIYPTILRDGVTKY